MINISKTSRVILPDPTSFHYERNRRKYIWCPTSWRDARMRVSNFIPLSISTILVSPLSLSGMVTAQSLLYIKLYPRDAMQTKIIVNTPVHVLIYN